MNAIHEPKSSRRLLTALCSCLPLFAGFGCASYFRTGEMSGDDLKEKQQERQAEERAISNPDTDPKADRN